MFIYTTELLHFKNIKMQITNTGLTATIGSNAGTGGTVNVKGDNTKGVISVTTGTNPGGRNICKVFFTQPYGSENIFVEILPMSVLSWESQAVAEASESGSFELNSNVQLDEAAGGLTYQWSYTVTEIIEPNTP